MDINVYNYNEEVSYTPLLPKDYTVTISPEDKVISIDDEGDLIASIKLDYDAESNTLLLIGKNDEEMAAVELPNFITSIDTFKYDEESHEIVFHAQQVGGDDIDFSFSINDLVDLYQAGDGIAIDQETKTISIKIKEDSKSILDADEDGLSIDLGGLDNRLTQLENLVGEYQEDASASTQTVIDAIQALQDLVGEQSEGFNESLSEIVEKHNDDIQELRSALGLNADADESLAQRVEEIAEIVGTQSEESGALTERLAELEELVGLNQEIASESDQSLLERLDTLESTVGERIGGVESSLTQMVSELKDDVEANKTDIASLTDGVNQNAANITLESESLEELKSSLLTAFGKDYGNVNVNESMSLFAATQTSEIADAFESLMGTTYDEIQKVATQHTEDFNEFISQSFVPLKESVDALKGDGEGSVAKAVSDAVVALVDGAPETFDTLKEIADYIASDASGAVSLAENVAKNAEDIAKNAEDIASNKQSIEDNKESIEQKLSDESLEIRGLLETLRDNTSAALSGVNSSIETLQSNLESAIELASEDLQSNFTTQLNDAISAESQVRSTKDDEIIGLVNGESSRAESEEARIESKIDGIVDNMNLSQVGGDGSYVKFVAQSNGVLSAESVVFESVLDGESTNAPSCAAVSTKIESVKTELNNKIESNASGIEQNAENIQHLTSVIEDTYFNGIDETANIGLIKALMDRIAFLESELSSFKEQSSTSLESAVADVKAYADGIVGGAVAESKEFATEKANAAEFNAKAYADDAKVSARDEAEASAKAYADGLVADVNSDIDEVKSLYVTKVDAQSEHESILAEVGSIYQEKGDYITRSESNVNDDAVKTHVEGVVASSLSDLRAYVENSVAAHEASVNVALSGYYTKSESDTNLANTISAEKERADAAYEKKGECTTMAAVRAMNYVTADALAAKNYQNAETVDAKIKVVSDKLADYYDKTFVDKAIDLAKVESQLALNTAIAKCAKQTDVDAINSNLQTNFYPKVETNAIFAKQTDLIKIKGNVATNTLQISDLMDDVRILKNNNPTFSSIKEEEEDILI